MHIDTIPDRNSRPAYLLRESVREGKHVRKRTLANLSSLPIEQIEAIRRILKGERLGPVEDGLEVVRSRAHGHVGAVRTAMQRLGFDKLVDVRSSRERDLVVAMVAERILPGLCRSDGVISARLSCPAAPRPSHTRIALAGCPVAFPQVGAYGL